MNQNQARINGRLFERLREQPFLTVQADTPEAGLTALLGLPVSREQFWTAVAELEQARELTRTPDSLTYRQPADRW
jgi:hypothetical protein